MGFFLKGEEGTRDDDNNRMKRFAEKYTLLVRKEVR